MQMHLIRSLILVVLGAAPLLSTSAPQGGRSSVSLSGPVFASQEMSQWCWAASVSNLFAYYGYEVSQARIVAEVYGGVGNMRSGDYSNLSRLLNRSWQDERGRRFSSRLVAALDIANGVNAINNDAIRQALDSDRPLVIGTTTHAMLVVGMQYNEFAGRVTQVSGVDLFDPWPGAGFRRASRQEVTPVPGGSLMFIADARITRGASEPDRGPLQEMGRSCQTQFGRCGPFYDQPAQPVRSSCFCMTPAGPVTGFVVR